MHTMPLVGVLGGNGTCSVRSSRVCDQSYGSAAGAARASPIRAEVAWVLSAGRFESRVQSEKCVNSNRAERGTARIGIYCTYAIYLANDILDPTAGAITEAKSAGPGRQLESWPLVPGMRHEWVGGPLRPLRLGMGIECRYEIGSKVGR